MRKQHESIKPRIERLAQKFNNGEDSLGKK